ncbi:hypothetical protein [Bounagaea algeriensis]
MFGVKYILLGAALVLVGILLRVYGGDTDVGPVNLTTLGNVLWIVGGVEILVTLGSLLSPNRQTK